MRIVEFGRRVVDALWLVVSLGLIGSALWLSLS
jgi:hypothetical protein